MRNKIWDSCSFYCNRHTKPLRMVPSWNGGAFFRCPACVPKNEEYPDGYGKGEMPCRNTLSYTVALDIVSKFQETVVEHKKNRIRADYLHMRFKCKKHKVTIIRYTPGDIRFSVENQVAM